MPNYLEASKRVVLSLTHENDSTGTINYLYWLDPVETVDNLKVLNVAIGANCWVKTKSAMYAKIATLPEGETADNDLFVASTADTYFWKKGGTGQGEGAGTTLTAAEIRDSLASLTDANRLDATAIKNLPSTGIPGKNPEFQVSASHIQYRLVGDTDWINLIPKADLIGEQGENPEFQVSASHIQYRLVGDTNWIDLIPKADLIGETGSNIELQKTATHIQWRVIGGSWANLVALSEIKGDAGAGISNGILALDNQTVTPNAPSSGGLIYVKNNQLYQRLSGGTEQPVGTGNASSGGREVLTADRIYYVRPDGNDNNNGLTNNSSGAFLTIPKFFNTLQSLDKNGFDVHCNVADGTYLISQPIVVKDGIGEGKVFLTGNVTTPSNCLITSTANIRYISKSISGTLEIKGFKFTNTGNNPATTFIIVTDGVTAISNLDFGDTTTGSLSGQFHLNVSAKAILYKIGNLTISGKAAYHEFITVNGVIRDYLVYKPDGNNVTVTLTNNPSFIVFNYTRYGGIYDVYFLRQTFSGSATGQRYSCESFGGIFTAGGGGNYFPGSIAGGGSGGFYS